MPLRKLELKPGFDGSWYSGQGHDDIRVLLLDLHQGVLELGVGKCEVLAHDSPKREHPTFGFDLFQVTPDVQRVWEFFIEIADFKSSSEPLSPAVSEALTTTQGRARLARMFQAGLTPFAVEERLKDPTLVYLRQKIKGLQVEVGKAQAAAQQEMNVPSFHRGGLRPQPAVMHVMLQHRIAALNELAAELELGSHLP